MLLEPNIETLFIQEPNTKVEIRIVDRSYPFRHPESDTGVPSEHPTDQTYGFAFTVSGLTTGSTAAIVSVTADAPGGTIDLSSVDASVFYPYSAERLPPGTSLNDYPKFTHEIRGPQVVNIKANRHPRR